MLFTKVKKGITWLRRDFEEHLKKTLDANHVVDLGKLVDFEGRERVIESMIIREELEEANYSDIQKQKKLDKQLKQQLIQEEKCRDKVKEEEEALAKVMGL